MKLLDPWAEGVGRWGWPRQLGFIGCLSGFNLGLDGALKSTRSPVVCLSDLCSVGTAERKQLWWWWWPLGKVCPFPGAVSVPVYERLQAASMFLILDMDNLGRVVKSKGSSCKGDNSGGKGTSPSCYILEAASACPSSHSWDFSCFAYVNKHRVKRFWLNCSLGIYFIYFIWFLNHLAVNLTVYKGDLGFLNKVLAF